MLTQNSPLTDKRFHMKENNAWHPSKIVALNESAVIQGVSIDSGGTDARRYGDSVGG